MCELARTDADSARVTYIGCCGCFTWRRAETPHACTADAARLGIDTPETTRQETS